MASVGHVVVGFAAGRYLAPRLGGSRLMWGGGLAVLSLAPDLDVIAFKLGIPYGHPFGHRGATHALFAGVIVGLLLWAAVRYLEGREPSQARAIGVVTGVVWMSHGLLDAMTDGGLGAALLWPFTDARYFFPWRPLPVAPIGKAYFTTRGLAVALQEVGWFVPLLVYALRPVPTPRAPEDGDRSFSAPSARTSAGS
jgi:inner membrane protein